MKRHPKILQIDKRGQLVIPKEIRNELNITEGTPIALYVVPDLGIMLKQMDLPEISRTGIQLKKHAQALGIPQEKIEALLEEYK